MGLFRLACSILITACILLVAGCSGTNQAFAPAPANGAAATPSTRTGGRPLSIGGSSSSGEQLFVLVGHAYPNEQSSLLRYDVGSTTPQASMQLPDSQSELAVSAQDQYVVTSGPEAANANVYGPNGSYTTIAQSSPGGTQMTMSTDNQVLGFITSNFDAGTSHVVEYRAPFTAPFQAATGQDPAPGGGISLLDEDGYQALGIDGDSQGGWAQFMSLPSGKSGSIAPPDGSIPNDEYEAFDGPQGWLYAWAERQSNGPTDRIEIFDTIHDKYLGYINLPANTGVGGMAVNQLTGDLYAVVNDKIYVYDIPHCGCTVPPHVFTSALAHQGNGTLQVAIDAQNEHLFVYETGPGVAAPYNQEIIDQNPVTGSVQQTYHVSTASDAQIFAVVAH